MIDVIAERSPLGGLERWLGDRSIDEVIVNGGGDVWIETAGTLGPSGNDELLRR